MKTSLLALSVSTLTLVACRGDDAPRQTSSATDAQAIVEGSPLGEGTLRFLNAENTTLSVLDVDVPLHAGAARNLIGHRDGDDATYGTADDDPFDTLEEVLGVRQVGPSRLAKIAAYAQAQGFVPEGNEQLGVYDDVAFTVNEAEATVAFVNGASETELDDDLALDRRAVDSILEARPLQSVKQLAGLYFVGTSALETLKEAATGAPSCEAATLPPTTPYSEPCTARIEAVVTADGSAHSSLWTTAADACDSGPDAARFVDLYMDYWINVAEVPEMVIGEDEPRQFRVAIGDRGAAGRVVSVDIGADEDRLDFVLDGQGQLLAYYQHNQTPEADYFCAQPGETPAPSPSSLGAAECLGAAVFHFDPYSDYGPVSVHTDGGTASDFSGHDALVGAAVARFRNQLSLGPASPIDFDYRLVTRPYDENGLTITLTSGTDTWTQQVINLWGEDPYLLTVDDGVSHQWLCESL